MTRDRYFGYYLLTLDSRLLDCGYATQHDTGFDRILLDLNGEYNEITHNNFIYKPLFKANVGWYIRPDRIIYMGRRELPNSFSLIHYVEFFSKMFKL